MSQTLAHSLDSKTRTEDVTVDANISFESLMLSENVLKGLRDAGFKKPSPIQCKAVPIGRCGFDTIVKSKSGTGKTLVFSIIALEAVNVEKHRPQVVVLAPTREIAVQIQEVLTSIGSHITGLKVGYFIGGLPLTEDKEKCQNCHIAVGAPGRIKHLISEGILQTTAVRLLILDEADKLLEPSFVNDINEIFNSLPDRKQIVTTSATYPKDLKTFLHKYMLSPTFIEAENKTPLLLGLKQFVKTIPTYNSAVQEVKYKNEALLDLFASISYTQCLIFTNYQTRAESISNFLNQNGWRSAFISAAQSQPQRLKTVNDLKNFKCKVLLTTDLTARGIDAANVDLVVNYDIPVDAMTYLHRMGRAGRYGSQGVCIDLVSDGKSLEQWRTILGVIGGCSLGVPKLPAFQGNVNELLKVDMPEDEFVFGTVSETYTSDLNNSIKKNVLELKKGKSAGRKRTGKCAEVNDAENFAGDESTESGWSDDVTEAGDIVSSLKNGHDPDQKTANNTAGNLSGIPGRNGMKTCDTKRESDTSTELIDPSNLYYRNMALLCVTKILSCDQTVDIPQPDLFALECYLKNLKSEEERELSRLVSSQESKSVSELLKFLAEKGDLLPRESENVSRSEDLNVNNLVDGLEGIFQAGYQHATMSNVKHWTETLPDEEVKKFKELCLKERFEDCREPVEEYEELDMDEDAYEEAMATESEEEQEETPGVEETCQPDIMKWVPVEKLEKTAEAGAVLHPEEENWEGMGAHFDTCSDTLWQTGLSFESVEDFDNWFFNDWQSRVLSVRDYVRQNVYVREMSNYQQSRYRCRNSHN